MAAPDRTAAFRRMMQTFRESYTPSAASDLKTRPAMVRAVEENFQLVQKLGMQGTLMNHVKTALLVDAFNWPCRQAPTD